MTSLGFTGPYTSSQHNQSGLIEELFAYIAVHPASIMPTIFALSNCDNSSHGLRKRRNDISSSALAL
ncbi:hypothetical protein TNCV_1259301 [Trichonephila clavipes]|nr:hypothetical protein TNCV_1259301 [Trichonephila clavipes]